MAIVAPVSKYKVKTYLIYMAVLVGFAAYCVYDGHFNDAFREKHAPDGKPDGTMVFNQKAPAYLVGAAVLLGVYLLVIRNRKIVADDNALVIDGKTSIPYDSVQKIDKTDFDKKGHFTFTYKTPDGKEIDRKISDRNYDNLKAILDHLVAKIS
ncbi:MAG: hypothetical protein ABSF37_08230 [Sedimentisphaerales bacterium]|jgi:hypothetical protein